MSKFVKFWKKQKEKYELNKMIFFFSWKLQDVSENTMKSEKKP